ncbi:unnamed protein product [Blepharisma stoltei]|uniref:Uncharacterized protein n=1 Tax=Blepharisma stoltei TaxID=1481888 RepID=A0AAU9K3L1_9CILI|nr:unnamed protein product [Blepharisma stoltei]
MSLCSLLAPAFTYSFPDSSSYYSFCSQNLGINPQEIELFALVPINEVSNPTQIAIKVKQSSFSLSSLEELISERNQLKVQLEKSREALLNYSEKILAQAEKGIPSDEKYKKKIAKLSEDNKKLRQLLKTQLENAENLRIETQKTVENLRQEFDMLVKELMAAKEGKTKADEKPPVEKRFVVPKLKI